MNIFSCQSNLLPVQTKINRRLGWFGSLTVWAILTTIGSAQAAERVELGIGPVEFGISVKELETYAKQGRVGKELEPFLSSIEPKDRKYVRQFLKLNSDFTSLQVSQFFRSAVGEKILTYVGDLVQSVQVPRLRSAQVAEPRSKRSVNGAKAIRTGLIAAAADPSGLSLLTFLRKYPAPTLRLNLEKGFEIANKIDKLGKETESTILGVEQLSSTLAKSEPEIESNAMADLANPGRYLVKLQTAILKDPRRSR